MADLSEKLVMALGAALVRNGSLSAMDMHDAATEAEQGGEAEVAHALRVMLVEAAADGGNNPTA